MTIIGMFIPGVMVGIEFVTEDNLIVIDLFILRIMVFYQ